MDMAAAVSDTHGTHDRHELLCVCVCVLFVCVCLILETHDGHDCCGI